MARLAWRHVVDIAGGVHEFGRLWIIIHNTGLTVAWKQVQRIDWKI